MNVVILNGSPPHLAAPPDRPAGRYRASRPICSR